MKTPRIYSAAYSLRAEKSAGGYRHFEILVMDAKQFTSEPGELRSLLKITWQANPDEPARFYGRTIALEATTSDGSDLAARLKIAARIIAAIDATPNDSPRATLDALKMPRVAYDQRISRHTTQADAPPTDERRFMDDYSIHGDDYGCTVAAMATDTDRAARKLSQEWAERLASHPSKASTERFARWTLAGCPVIKSDERYYGKPADFPPLAELLNEPAEAPAEPATQAA